MTKSYADLPGDGSAANVVFTNGAVSEFYSIGSTEIQNDLPPLFPGAELPPTGVFSTSCRPGLANPA
jgi:hypothetical protein